MDELSENVSKLLLDECSKIISKVCHMKHLDEKQLKDIIIPNKIYFNELANNTVLKKKKKTNRRILPKNERCLGRKNDLTQCTRKRKDEYDFCGSHIKNIPNGMMGDDGSCFNKKKGKRGRKRKNVLDNPNEYGGILTTKKYINGNIYLVDSQNVVICYKENKPVILGVLKNDKLDPDKFINYGIDDPLIRSSIN